MKSQIQKLVYSSGFDYFMTFVIFVNAVFIGFEISQPNPIVSMIQSTCLVIFIIEIILRWVGRKSNEEYFNNGWNWYDVIIVVISLIPESLFSNADMVSALRILRVFRIFRVFKAIPSMATMARVLVSSIKSLFQATFFLLVFMYLYAIIGIILFEGATVLDPNDPQALDPYGSIGETFFSLFRITTGEDWTDLRYDLMNKEHTSNLVVNIYHISWMILSSFLLLNIIIGAIVSNYEQDVNAEKDKEDKDKMDLLLEKVISLEAQLAKQPPTSDDTDTA